MECLFKRILSMFSFKPLIDTLCLIMDSYREVVNFDQDYELDKELSNLSREDKMRWSRVVDYIKKNDVNVRIVLNGKEKIVCRAFVLSDIIINYEDII